MTLFDLPPPPSPPHKTQVREQLLGLSCGTEIIYRDAYRLTRDIAPRPVNWQANVRDEMHRLRDRGYFTSRPGDYGAIYTRTDKS